MVYLSLVLKTSGCDRVRRKVERNELCLHWALGGIYKTILTLNTLKISVKNNENIVSCEKSSFEKHIL